MQPMIRPATRADLPRLVQIYNHFVSTSHVTFDVTPFTVSEREPWFASFSDTGSHRLLVAELNSVPVGYAASKEYRPKPAYTTSVETTAYMDPEHMGQGIGKKLYTTLMDSLKTENVHRVYAAIALPNPISISLHAKLGFKHIGTHHEVGWKFGKYWDVDWYEKCIE